MRCSCTMMSPKDTSPEEEGRDANGVNWDGAEREEGAAEFDYRDRNWGLATFNGSVIYGTHDGKVVGRGKRNKKMA